MPWLVAKPNFSSKQSMNHEELVKLATALAALSPDERQAVELHHLKGWSLAEVAKQMGRNKTAVMGLVFRGLKKLREQLGDEGTGAVRGP